MIEYGADKAYVIDELEKILPRYLEKTERVHYPIGLQREDRRARDETDSMGAGDAPAAGAGPSRFSIRAR